METLHLRDLLDRKETLHTLREIFLQYPDGMSYSHFHSVVEPLLSQSVRREIDPRDPMRPLNAATAEWRTLTRANAATGGGGRRRSQTGPAVSVASPTFATETAEPQDGEPGAAPCRLTFSPFPIDQAILGGTGLLPACLATSDTQPAVDSRASGGSFVNNTSSHYFGGGAISTVYLSDTSIQSTMHSPDGPSRPRGRQAARLCRIESGRELADERHLHPLKRLFNAIDASNRHVITWDEFMRHIVLEAGGADRVARLEGRPYVFSRARLARPRWPQEPLVGGDSLGLITDGRQPEGSYQEQLQKHLTAAGQLDDTHAGSGGVSSPGRSGGGGGRGKKAVSKYNAIAALRPRGTASDLSSNVSAVDGLPDHPKLFLVSTTAVPVGLYSKATLSLVRAMSLEEVGGAHPDFVCYLPKDDMLVAYSRVDRTLRGWRRPETKVPIPAFDPLVFPFSGTSAASVRQMRAAPQSAWPASVFLADTHGNVTRIDLPESVLSRQAKVATSYPQLHPRSDGGVVDIVLGRSHLFTCGFDHHVMAVHLESGARQAIGRTPTLLQRIVHCPSIGSVVGITLEGELRMWDTKVRGLSGAPPPPGSVFHHGDFKPHTARIVGALCAASPLPQIITADVSGAVKVWDLRQLRCTQSTTATGTGRGAAVPEGEEGGASIGRCTRSAALSPGGASGPGAPPGAEPPGLSRTVVGLAYLPDSHEIVTSTTDSLYALRYHALEDVRVCDTDVVMRAMHNTRQRSFILQGPTRISTWDADGGFRRALMDRTQLPDLPAAQQEILCVCVNDLRSRLYVGLADGTVLVYSTQTQELVDRIDNHDLILTEMVFSNSHQMLAGASTVGSLLLHCEDEERPYSVVSKLSSAALVALDLSDELGLVACLDEMDLVTLQSLRHSASRFSSVQFDRPVTQVRLLGPASVLVVAHDGGDVTFWSCPPAAATFCLLTTLHVFAGGPAQSVIRARTSVMGRAETVTHHPNGYPARPTAVAAVGATTTTTTTATAAPATAATVGGGGHRVEQDDSIPPSPVNSLQRRWSREEQASDSFHLLERLARQHRRHLRYVTDIAYDDQSHSFYASDNKGDLHVYTLCPLLQTYKVPTAVFEVFVEFPLENVTSSSRLQQEAARPTRVNCVHDTHSGAILALTWLPSASTLLSSGVDRRVLLHDWSGELVSALSIARLPPSTSPETPSTLPLPAGPLAPATEATSPMSERPSTPAERFLSPVGRTTLPAFTRPPLHLRRVEQHGEINCRHHVAERVEAVAAPSHARPLDPDGSVHAPNVLEMTPEEDGALSVASVAVTPALTAAAAPHATPPLLLSPSLAGRHASKTDAVPTVTAATTAAAASAVTTMPVASVTPTAPTGGAAAAHTRQSGSRPARGADDASRRRTAPSARPPWEPSEYPAERLSDVLDAKTLQTCAVPSLTNAMIFVEAGRDDGGGGGGLTTQLHLDGVEVFVEECGGMDAADSSVVTPGGSLTAMPRRRAGGDRRTTGGRGSPTPIPTATPSRLTSASAGQSKRSTPSLMMTVRVRKDRDPSQLPLVVATQLNPRAGTAMSLGVEILRSASPGSASEPRSSPGLPPSTPSPSPTPTPPPFAPRPSHGAVGAAAVHSARSPSTTALAAPAAQREGLVKDYQRELHRCIVGENRRSRRY